MITKEKILHKIRHLKHLKDKRWYLKQIKKFEFDKKEIDLFISFGRYSHRNFGWSHSRSNSIWSDKSHTDLNKLRIRKMRIKNKNIKKDLIKEYFEDINL